ncbi:MAG TPA: ribonuclease HII [Clostridiaceae bacterium]|nr:ribonuclease HII [Clostridiaceae bacterium]
MSRKLTLREIEEKIKGLDIDDALNYLHSVEPGFGNSIKRLISKYEKKKESMAKEIARIDAMYAYERKAYEKGYRYIAGVDEAGRGPLAGPVVAAAVILPDNVCIYGLNDSKKLTPKQRDSLYDEITEKAVSFSIGIVDEKQIDSINILNATKTAMEKAISSLKPQPDIIFIDAVELENIKIEQVPIVKGDSKSISIAAASIVAKVTRDRLIDELDQFYPQYGFKKHKGYGTKEHIKAIKKYGICPIHRVSFTKKFTL